MSNLEFPANLVKAEEANGVDMVAFADDPTSPANYLIIQKAQSFDEQDISLGQATYHVEISGQEASFYGGVQNYTVNEDVLVVHFDSSKSKSLEQITISRSVDLLAWDRTRRHLTKILES